MDPIEEALKPRRIETDEEKVTRWESENPNDPQSLAICQVFRARLALDKAYKLIQSLPVQKNSEHSPDYNTRTWDMVRVAHTGSILRDLQISLDHSG